MDTIWIISLLLLWVVGLFNLVLVLAMVRRLNMFIRAHQGGIINTDMIGKKAPDFTVENLSGQPVTLSDYADQKTVLVVVSPDCSPCRAELPSMCELYPRAKQMEIEMVLVSLGNPDDTKKMVNEFNLQLPVLVAPRVSNLFSNDYRVPGTPAYYLIDQKGNIEHVGFFDDEWTRMINKWRSATSTAN